MNGWGNSKSYAPATSKEMEQDMNAEQCVKYRKETLIRLAFEEMVEALTKIRDASDSEMMDGDFSRNIAEQLLARHKELAVRIKDSSKK